jgi:hypothetical protein
MITILLWAALATAAAQSDNHNPAEQKQSEVRGQTPENNERVGRTPPTNKHRKPGGKEMTVTGILIDAGCQDRTALNLARPPRNRTGATPPDGPDADRNINPEAERAGAIAQQVPETINRQPDMTCAVTEATRGFALLLDDGRLVNLDEAGNTRAIDAVGRSAAGRAMLNGKGPAVKPKVEVTGRFLEERLLVTKLRLLK